MKSSKTSSSENDKRPDDKTVPVSAKASDKEEPKAKSTPDANAKEKPKTNGKPAPITKPDALKKTAAARKSDALDKTAPISNRAAMRHEKTAPVSERVRVKHDEKTAPVTERAAVKHDAKTAPVTERAMPREKIVDGPEIPNYKILHQIGKGGYGEVWLARSVTGSLRAVKVVKREDFANERAFEREFEGIQNYEPVSKEHTGLVDILHVGRDDKQGFYYYVMDLADDVSLGRDINVDEYEPLTLSRKLRRGAKLGLDDCMTLGQTMSEALGALHTNKLTHRDVKPSNIIYVRGLPQLADPGLVASAGQDTFVGTEGYVPPEGPGTPLADLYSLGMVLYEMNTGKDRMDFPELPTIVDPDELNLRERSELNTIICKTCAPRPKQRFGDAAALGHALSNVGKIKRAPARAGWKFAAAAGVMLLLGGGVVAGMMLGDRGNDPNEPSYVNPPIPAPPNGDPAEPPNLAAVTNPSDGDPNETPTAVTPNDNDPNGGQTVAAVDPENQVGSNPNPETQQVGPDRSGTPDSPNGQETSTDPDVLVVSGSPNSPSESPNPPNTPDGGPPQTVDTQVPEPEPASVVGNLRMISFPPDAEVYLNDEKIGAAPIKMELEADNYKVRFVKEGYREHEILARVKVGETVLVNAELAVWRPPVEGQQWENSIGMPFQPLSPQAGHRTVGAIRKADFDKFTGEVGADDMKFAVGLDDVVFADAVTRQAFCDWMTTRDRAEGFLDEKRIYMQHLAEPLDGSPDLASFQTIVGEHRFGRVIVSSEPAGADVYKDGKKIGMTPMEIPDMDVGPVAYEIRMAGFKAATVEGLVNFLEPLKLEAELEDNQSVVFDKEWTNHLEMKFVPFEEILVSVYETRIKDYEKYWETKGIEDRYYETDFDQGPDHPVVNVQIGQARKFCEWLTEVEREQERIQQNHFYRLPTDQEWSRLAGLENEVGTSPEGRDGKIRNVFPWGTQWPPPAGSGNYADTSAKSVRAVRYQITGYNDGFARTAPVGSFPPNKHGVFDLAGNVWEYCNDNYSARRNGGPYPVVMRGGSWQDYRKDNFETAHRNVSTPEKSHPLWGFRIVLVKEAEPIQIQADSDDN
ncbi:MAG: SUMF1/EgtB/PvdO family nonheme iron enzyme [Verrucomicrobiota bacterium]